jgi:hypothetical protein
VAAEAKHVRSRRLASDGRAPSHMRRHIQTFKLNLTYTVMEGDTHGLGGFGRILSHVAGHLLAAQLPSSPSRELDP